MGHELDEGQESLIEFLRLFMDTCSVFDCGRWVWCKDITPKDFCNILVSAGCLPSDYVFEFHVRNAMDSNPDNTVRVITGYNLFGSD